MNWKIPLLVLFLLSLVSNLMALPDEFVQDEILPDTVRSKSIKGQMEWLDKEGNKFLDSDHLQAVLFFKYGESLAREVEDWESLLEFQSDLARLFLLQGFYDQVLELSEEGLKISREIKDTRSEIYFLFWQSGAYNELQKTKQSILSSQQAYDLALETGETVLIFWSLNSLGEAYRYSAQYQEAKSNYLRGLKAFQEREDSTSLPSADLTLFNNLALTYYELGQIDSALYYIDNVSDFVEQNPTNPLAFENNLCKVNILEKMGKSTEARDLALQNQAYAAQSGYIRYEMEYDDWLSAYFKKSVTPAKAIPFIEKSTEIKEIIREDAAQMRIALNEIELENRTLRSRTTALQHQKQNQTYVSLSLGIIILFILITGWLLLRNNHKMKNLNAELAQKNQRLDDANREINGLISIVAHDLRSPLNKVHGLINLIKLSETRDPEIDLYLEMIESVLGGGTHLIQDILILSSLEDENSITKIKNVDLVPSFTFSVDLIREEAGKKQITIQSKAPDSLYAVTEVNYFGRILDNLLSNAVKFSPKGKQVFVELGETEQTVFFRIEDQGPGISDSDQSKMFKRFQKLSARPTAKESSTGLGLSIIKTLVDKLGGKISMTSELGNGTTFIVSLPKNG